MRTLFRLLSVCLLALSAQAASADTLREIYELALENDAQLKSLEATYRANLETENLGLAPLLPQVNANYDYTKNETNTDSNSISSDGEGGFGQIKTSSKLDVDTDGYQVSLNQTIFNLPAWFSFQASKEITQQAEATFAADQQDLIVRVVGAYLNVLRAQDNLTASQAQERAFQRQLEQTQQRFEVGLIAITDVHEAQAAFDLAGVTRIIDENNLNVSLERLSVLTGRYHSNLHVLREDFAIKPPQPADRSEWVDFALDNNFRLTAARYGEEGARQNAKANKMGHMPVVSGSVIYNDYSTNGDFTVKPGTPFDTNPDQNRDQEIYQVRVDLPLFAGGSISANRRQAAEQYLSAKESRINLMRNTVTNTRSLHLTVLSDVARVAAQKQSIISSQSALDATQAGYEVGTRNVVDVLNAQNVLFSAERDYANARYDYVRDILLLKQQAGLLSPEDVYRLNGELVPPAAPTATTNPSASPYPTR
jgi:outer membrane protein